MCVTMSEHYVCYLQQTDAKVSVKGLEKLFV